MTTGPEEQDLSEHPLAAPLFSQSSEEEREVLNAILSAGLDEGWIVRPRPDQLITDSALVERVVDGLDGRPQAWPDIEDPWRDGLPPPPRDLGDEPAWVVLSQRCDLIRGYALEPFVELARVSRITDKAEARAATINSSRLIAIASDDRGLLAADMRSRAWIPKNEIVAVGCHATIAESSKHKRFRHRLGGRYARDAVPDDLRDGFAVPLSKAFSKGARNRLLRHFTALLGRREGDRVMVLAIIDPNASEEAALLDWEEALAELHRISPAARELVHPDSQALPEWDLSLSEYLDTFKFDFDSLSYGSGAAEGHSPPLQ